MTMTFYAGIQSDIDGHPVYGPVIDFKHHAAEIDLNATNWLEEPVYVPNPDYLPNAAFDLSNNNARTVLQTLGLAMDGESAILPIGQVHAACLRWTNARWRSEGPSAPVASTTTRGALGATMVDCGRHEGYMDDIIARLFALVVEGQKRGATDLVVG
jgi:hypothetical protein